MQNKPNLPDTQMNVSSAITMNYEQLTMNYANKNKPNSKPIEPKTNPKQTQFKANTNPNKPNFKRDLAKMGHHKNFLFVLRLVC